MMVKYECAQEMVLDLVIRHGCEVAIRPCPNILGDAVEIVISHKDTSSAVTIDLTEYRHLNLPTEEIACRMILRAAMDLFKYPYDRIFDRHFRDGDVHE